MENKQFKITLKTLSQATEQQVFDQAYKHLINQGKRSVSDDNILHSPCVYLSDKGLKCAAGCFISKDEYKPEFENNLWCGLVYSFGVPKEHYDLIIGLQSIHDNIIVELWKEKLFELAQEFNLTIPEIV